MSDDDKRWMKTFQRPPEGYTFHEFKPEDGVLENIIIDNPIMGGTMRNAETGEPVAYAGVNTIAGRQWVFFFIKDDNIRNHGLWLTKLIRDSLKMCREGGITELYALCDKTKPNAEAFLKFLGFEQLSVYEKEPDMILYEKLMGAKAWRRIEKGT